MFPNMVEVGDPIAPAMEARPEAPLLAQAAQSAAPGAISSTRDFVAAAIESGDTLQIQYLDGAGAATARTIRPKTWVDGDRFTAFCELRNAERDFRVSRIKSCRVVD